jgi:hypothetical protein
VRTATGIAISMIVALAAPALAESRTTEKSARAQSGKDLQIGVYINIRPDCTSGPLPAIRLSTPPVNGRVMVKKGKVTATNFKQCLALEVPGYIAFYRSRDNFNGIDTLELEVKLPDGGLEIQKFQITVGASPAAQPI